MTFDVMEVKSNGRPIGVFEKEVAKDLGDGLKIYNYKCVWTRFKGSDYWSLGQTYGPRLPKMLASIHKVKVKEISLADKTMIRMQYGPSDQEEKDVDSSN